MTHVLHYQMGAGLQISCRNQPQPNQGHTQLLPRCKLKAASSPACCSMQVLKMLTSHIHHLLAFACSTSSGAPACSEFLKALRLCERMDGKLLQLQPAGGAFHHSRMTRQAALAASSSMTQTLLRIWVQHPFASPRVALGAQPWLMWTGSCRL